MLYLHYADLNCFCNSHEITSSHGKKLNDN